MGMNNDVMCVLVVATTTSSGDMNVLRMKRTRHMTCDWNRDSLFLLSFFSIELTPF